MKYFYKDLKIGDVFESGFYEVSEDEIISFSEKYDQLPIHLKACASDNVIASGWLICSLAMKQSIEALLGNSSAYISPGIEKLSWKKTLGPGDKIMTRITVTDKRVSESKENLGIVYFKVNMFNQNNEEVMSMLPSCFFKFK